MKITALVALIYSFLCISLNFNAYAGVGLTSSTENFYVGSDPITSGTHNDIVAGLKEKAQCTEEQAQTVLALLIQQKYLIPEQGGKYQLVFTDKTSKEKVHQLIKANCG